MAQVNKLDSNFTGLRYAVEESPGVLPTTPVWIPLEPNEYKDFGGELTTKARMPINASRQRKKGVPMDIEATAGYVQDVTASNAEGLLQSFLFSATRTKPTVVAPTVAASTDDYQPASGGLDFSINDLIFADGFTANANNGLKLVDGACTATSIPVSGNLTDGATQVGTVVRVGTQFASASAAINATASEFPMLEVTAPVAATGVLTLADNPSDGETVTIGGRVYTFQDPFVDAVDNVDIGASASATIDNLIAAITGGAGAGTLYGTGTTVNDKVTAVAGTGDTMDVTAIYGGLSGNQITTVGSNGSTFASGTLTGGTGKDLRSLGLIPGEFVFIGGDSAGLRFAGLTGGVEVNNGYARVRSVAAAAITFDKTQHIMIDDAGTGKTIQLFYGNPLKNEVDRGLIIKRTLQFERVLGAPDDSDLEAVESEYITNSLANEAMLDAKTADFLRLEVQCMSGDSEQRDAADGLKTGERPELVETDAFNTTSDVSLIKMAAVTEGDSCPTPMFAYLTDLAISINNNAKQNKAISVFGSFDVTAGTFEVTAEVTAYFQSVAAIRSARNNDSVTLEAHFAKENKGLTVDLPLITIGKISPEVKLDEPIMLPLESDAATAKIIDPTLDYTIMFIFWPYLPTLAE